jgi:hypothetical protein
MNIITKVDNFEDINDEYILYNHNFIKSKIEFALNIVKEYIIKNKLLIVGGTAIDYALKLKGTTLYNDLYQIPDFDIISPNNVEHANNIGQILCNNKFENISIIPAIHHTTVRVQLLGFTVFDSTYVPEYVYNKIPTLEYNEFKFVDPNFQKINQYLSLSFLFKITGPSYNILNRFKKDVERYNMLDKYYNFNNDFEINIDKINKFKLNLNNINIESIKIIDQTNIYFENLNKDNKELYKLLNKKNICYNIKTELIIHGIPAYYLIYKKFNNLYNKLIDIIKLKKEDKEVLDNLYNNIKIKKDYYINKDYIEFDIPENIEICFLHNLNNIDNLSKKLNIQKIVKLDNILEFKPKYLEGYIEDIKTNIYDLYGDLIGINMFYINEIDQFIPISTYTYNLVYFLTNYYLEENITLKNIYLGYYISLKNIIDIIQYIYYNYTDEFEKTEDFINSIFNYSINTCGIKNYPDHYYHFIENFEYLVKNNKNLNTLPPKNYISHPDCDIKNTFDFIKSPYYNKIQKKINNTNYSNLIK